MSKPQTVHNATNYASDDDTGHLHIDDRLHEEMQRLAAINRELLGKNGDSQESFQLPEAGDELALLRTENAELRMRIDELEHALQEEVPGEAQWAERQKEYEALLEEKSEVIRALHLKVQDLQEGSRSPTQATAASADDANDVQRLKQLMEEQRRQLERDEESLMEQMRQMEMAMSKDRAELARQRNEVQRLHNEVNHEIELAARDPGLRERLIALQRLQGEIVGRKQQGGGPQPPSKQPPAPAPVIAPVSVAPTLAGKKSSGLLRRIFGK